MVDRSQPRIAVIGAGPSGLAALKVLRQHGFCRAVALEQGERVGGNWVYSAVPGHSSVFETTHVISSKALSGYSDFPMPDDYPDYPSHRQMAAYFEAYARHFQLTPAIRFGVRVARAEPGTHGWHLVLGDGRSEEFDAVLVASGHHWSPRMPSYPGRFTGRMLHSHDFKSADPFRGERVLVIGGGNSACDIAVETSRVSAATGLSTRRGYYIVPKFVFGIPPDVLNAKMLRIPAPIRNGISRLTWRLATGGMARYGLPEPTHGITEAHPTINSELLYLIRHGRIRPWPDITRFEGQTVHFADGRSAEFDTIIAATGFRIEFPFLDKSVADFSDGPVPLYLRVFPARPAGLYFIGLVQPQGCIWPLAEAQAEVVACLLSGELTLPADLEAAGLADSARIARRFIPAARHTVEVDFHEHLAELRTVLKASGRRMFRHG